MDKICPSCLYVGIGECPPKYRVSLIFFYAVLTFISILIAITYSFAFIFAFLFLAILLNLVSNNLAERITCPKCKNHLMILVHSVEAKHIIDDNKLDVDTTEPNQLNTINRINSLKYQKDKICKECLKQGVGDINTRCNIYSAIIFIIGGIISIPLAIFNSYTVIGSGLLILSGIISLFNCVVESNRCPACNKNSMIPIVSDAAKELIKIHNIDIRTDTNRLKSPMLKRDPGVIIFIGILVLLVFILYKFYGFFSNF